MITFEITTDDTPRVQKPTASEVGTISKKLRKRKTVNLDQFSQMMSNGYTWSAGIFNGTRSNKNWIEQQVLALDFDNGVTPEQIIKRFKKYNIFPNIMYPSFSDSPQLRKFRIVLLLDTKITDRKERDYVQRGLMNLIGDVDIACKDAARLFYGGSMSVVNNYQPVSYSALLDVINVNVIANDAGQTRKVKKVCVNESPYKDYIEVPVQQQKDEIEKFNFDDLYSKVQIYKDFIDGVWLTHPQLFGLATSLHWIRGGTKLMRDTMNKHNNSGKTRYTTNNFACLTYVRYAKYQPQRLSNYSPYEEDYDLHNPIKAVKNQRGSVIFTETINKAQLLKTETTMKNQFKEILERKNDNNIYIMKLPTGIGKTEMLKSTKAVIALPTNKLKDEVYERVTVEKIKTPVLPTLEDRELEERLNYLYQVGLHEQATSLITAVANGRNRDYSQNDAEALREYQRLLRHCYTKRNSAIVTTHRRALHSKFSNDTVIFDEDPLKELLEIKQFDLSDFLKLEGQRRLFDRTELSGIIDYLRHDIKPSLVYKRPTFKLNLNDLAAKVSSNILSTDILSFFESSYFFRAGKQEDEKAFIDDEEGNTNIFTYIVENKIPADRKVIIMSATVPISVYKELYGDRVKVLDLSDVEHTGQIIQNTKRSFSRTSLAKSIDKIEDIIDTSLPTITFKSSSNKIKNAVKDMYFGNVSGYDQLKGEDINVVGTPHLSNDVYFLIASCMDSTRDFKTSDYAISFREIEWNGRKFNFNAFHNETLMDIQLSLIESDLLQAVGRARALREDCTVHLYSNLPLRISTKFVR